NKRASGRSFDKVLNPQWPTRNQLPSAPDRHLGGQAVIEALRRICADCKNKSAQRQNPRPLKFAWRFLQSTRRPRVGLFIATPPIAARRVLTRRSRAPK